ncbi:MAG TPA: response regulator, partial [Gaiellaceae bacterium]|nr:response regulator [Gaiellaceae bacterium]
ELQRQAIAERGGEEVDCRGDEIFSVFPDPSSAAAAALAIQRAFAATAWAQGEPVRVRIGLHFGEAEKASDGLVGVDVHRASRISHAGHGGQVLASHAVASRIDAPSKALGEFEFRGLREPERIYQLVADDLQDDFPALRNVRARAQRLSVVIAEDSTLLREGIARLLEDEDFDVVGQAGTADELMLKVRSYRPDVAIVDVRMPPTQTDEGIKAAREIRAHYPDTSVLVLSQHVEHTYAVELLGDGAQGLGYLLKDRIADIDEFIAAVRRVAEGGSALDPHVVSELVALNRGSDPVQRLTPREHEVLELMAEGRSNQAIGQRLFITPRAVEKHVTSIFTKLGLPAAAEDHRRVLAVLQFLGA